jgi:hypothetical protein
MHPNELYAEQKIRALEQEHLKSPQALHKAELQRMHDAAMDDRLGSIMRWLRSPLAPFGGRLRGLFGRRDASRSASRPPDLDRGAGETFMARFANASIVAAAQPWLGPISWSCCVVTALAQLPPCERCFGRRADEDESIAASVRDRPASTWPDAAYTASPINRQKACGSPR